MDDAAWVEQLKADFRQAPMEDADRIMLEYCDKLTRRPAEMSREDLKRLRAAGFSDRAILDMAQVTGYFAFVNRLADGLGVELEPFWKEQ